MNPRMKNNTPILTATMEIILMNLSNSFLNGVSSLPELSTKFAICPITVLSPVNITIPFPWPLSSNNLYFFAKGSEKC